MTTLIRLPNYLIINILNILSSYTQFKLNLFSLIEKISLVSREWKDSLLTKVNFEFGMLSDRGSFQFIRSLLDRGLTRISISISGKRGLVDDAIHLLNHPKISEITIGTLHLYTMTKDTQLNLENNLKPLRAFEFHETPDQMDLLWDRLKLNRSFNLIDTLCMSLDLNILKYFKNIQNIHFHQQRIEIATILKLVQEINPKSLKLHSTPYGYGQETYHELFKWILESDRIETFIVNNQYVSVNRADYLAMINHPTLTTFHASYINGSTPVSVPIRNSRLREYIDFNGDNKIIESWECLSNLRSIKMINLTETTMQCISKFHYKNLQKIYIDNSIEDIFILCKLVEQNLSFHTLHIYDNKKRINSKLFMKSLKSNNTLRSLIVHYGDPEFYRDILKLEHPTIKKFKIQTTSQNIQYFEQDIINNKTITQLDIQTKNMEFNGSFKSLLNIINNNKTLNVIGFPAPLQHQKLDNDEVQLLDTALSNSPQLLSLRIAGYNQTRYNAALKHPVLYKRMVNCRESKSI
ncbi:hypothetical protein DLAC_07967 [Tieghemostelium lacteum]|uniref:Uncharacterized protein n=1 Tax=Tieghemostelium lacteum TaxID=361077 RepID=A0A151ZAV3_TIELA|nr:hypothetical protein DLAC_07967 [Tieghemostelium lacteum]|eukprot:KYQ91065.1 hypothetical protein DLAC_07967 [Tieghemostelium lacteum]